MTKPKREVALCAARMIAICKTEQITAEEAWLRCLREINKTRQRLAN